MLSVCIFTGVRTLSVHMSVGRIVVDHVVAGRIVMEHVIVGRIFAKHVVVGRTLLVRIVAVLADVISCDFQQSPHVPVLDSDAYLQCC